MLLRSRVCNDAVAVATGDVSTLSSRGGVVVVTLLLAPLSLLLSYISGTIRVPSHGVSA